MGFKKDSPAYKFCLENHYCTKCGDKTAKSRYGWWYKTCGSCRDKSLYHANKRRARECTELDACPACSYKMKPDEEICPNCGADFWEEKAAELERLKKKKW